MKAVSAQLTGITSLERALLCLSMILFPLQIRKYVFSLGDFSEWSSFFFYLSDAVFLLLCVLWVFREGPLLVSEARKIFAAKNDPALYAVLFLAALLGSVIASPSFFLALFQWFHVVELFLFAWYFKRITQTIGVKILFGFFVFGMTVQAVMGILQFFMQHDLGLWFLKESELGPALAGVAKIAGPSSASMIRAYGLFPHPNIFAFFLTVAIFLLLYLYLEKNIAHPGLSPNALWQKNTVLFCISGAVLWFALILTFSRVALVGCVVFLSAFFVIVASRKHLKKAHSKTLVLAAVFLALCFIIPATFYRNELLHRLDVSSKEQSVQLRSYYTEVAETYVAARPLLGVGVGHFVARYKEAESPLVYFSRLLPPEKAKVLVGDGMSAGWIYKPVHNLYLLIASEAGVVGLGIMVAGIVCAIGVYIKKRHSADNFGAPEEEIFYHIARTMALFLFLLLLFHGSFDHFFWTSQQGRMAAGFILGVFSRYI